MQLNIYLFAKLCSVFSYDSEGWVLLLYEMPGANAHQIICNENIKIF